MVSSPADEADEDDETATATGAEASGVQRAVPREEAKAYADESGLLFFETSAKTGEGVVELFTEIGESRLHRMLSAPWRVLTDPSLPC